MVRGLGNPRCAEDCLAPVVLRVPAGATVEFRNDSKQVHAVAGVRGAFRELHEEVMAGEAVTETFGTPGVIPYVCIIHPGMVGAIVVGDGLPVAVDAASGATDADAGAASTSAAGGGSGATAPLALAVAGALALGTALAVAGRRRHAPAA